MIKKELPVIILKGIILLPNNEIKLEFENDLSKNIIDIAELFHNNKILVVSNDDPLEEEIDFKKLPNIGTLATISHKIKLPNGKIRIIISGIRRQQVCEYLNKGEKNDILEAIVSDINIKKIDKNQENLLIQKLYKDLENYSKTIPYISNSFLSIIKDVKTLDETTDIVVPYINSNNKRLREYLYETNSTNRLKMILKDMYLEMETFKLEREIDNKVKINIDENQREYLLKEKLKTIKQELKEKSIKENDIDKIREKLKTIDFPKNIKNRLEEELERYEATQESSQEISVIRNYIDWFTNIPWNIYTKDNDNIQNIVEILDKSHSGLDELKERFIEYIAVRKNTNNKKSPIICLVGPPGVGKTSFVYTLSKALNRNFTKISVGGVNDEAEIIGHRRTYLAANPGRIIQSLKKAKSMNPIFLIDEIDKMTKGTKGDPASVFLEILDPEQNKHFSDNYIEEEVDLSNVMFIVTANYIENIPEPLKDRLEIINISGYTEYEKLDIARSHLIPKISEEHGLNNQIYIDDNILTKIIREYTKESGVRELNRMLEKIVRKIVTRQIIKKDKKSIILNESLLYQLIGQPIYQNKTEKADEIGVVNALAYTLFGGEVLDIEVNYFKGNGNIEITGSIGEVMKESVKIAYDYIKTNYRLFDIDYRILKENDIHIHIPKGSVKKDGPSAGVAITTSLISALTNRYVSKKVAMTGEITLRGNILKIGGLKEKAIAAFNSGITKIYIPSQNKSDIEKLPNEVKENIEFVLVSNYEQLYSNIKEVK